MPNGDRNRATIETLREQLREAKLGYQQRAGEIQRLSWELNEAHDRILFLEKQLATRAA